MRLRSHRLIALLGMLLLAVAALAACGSHGQAAPLGEAGHVSLPAPSDGTSAGSATFTPFYATHVVPYYQGQAIPLTHTPHPALLVSGTCGGPFVAALTDGIPTPAQQPNPPIVTAPDSNGGVDVSVAPSANLYVEVLDHPNDPNAPIVACGHPLSNLRQFFDLYSPNAGGSNGVGRGTALMEPVAATRLSLTLPAGWYTDTATWALSTGSCSGARIATGQIQLGVSPVQGVVFRPLDTQHWWLSITGGNGGPVCGQVTP